MQRAGWLALVWSLCVVWPAGSQVFDATVIADEQYENLGGSIALSGDTLVAGSRMSPGSVEVYVRNGSSWMLQADLYPHGPSFAGMGFAVALDGDVVLSGAPETSDGAWLDPGFQRGAAYIFRRNGVTWTEEAFLQPAAVQALDQFGRAVALDGDLAVVGGSLADPLGEHSGRVWIYRRASGSWNLEQSLVSPDGAAGHRFGEALAVSSTTLVVGATGADGVAPACGAAYVYVHDGSAWSLQQKLIAPDGARDDRFGKALALDGDQLVVGVPRRDSAGIGNAGAVAVFLRTGSVWNFGTWLSAATPRPVDNLGTAVALQGDVLIAGVPDDDSGEPMGGLARLWRRIDGTFVEQAPLLSPLTSPGTAYGVAVALDSDHAAISCQWRVGTGLGADGGVDVWSGVLGGNP